MHIGPKQTILVASLATTGASYRVGVTDAQAGLTASVNVPVTGTLGATYIAMRAYAATGTGTIQLAGPHIFSWTGVAATLAATPANVVTGWVIIQSVAAAASTFTTANTAFPMVLYLGDAATNPLPIPFPAMCPQFTIGTANITGLTIEARVIHMPNGLRQEIVDHANVYAAAPSGW